MRFFNFKVSDFSPIQIGVSYSNSPDIIYPLSVFDISYANLDDLVKNITSAELERLNNSHRPDIALPVDSIIKVSPITSPVGDVICLGINYMDHAAESSRFSKSDFDGSREHAVYFSKRVNAFVPDDGIIPSHSDIVTQLDYEAELAVILKKDACNVKAENAKDYIFGYTIINDVSARDIQHRHKQWYFGKSLDGFCPAGPCIVTPDEFDFPPKLNIKSYVNGELRQNSNTGYMIFDIPYIIEELSQGTTLKAGTVISTGTPAGVGMGFVPPRFLNVGDEVICEIEGIGRLRNVIGE